MTDSLLKYRCLENEGCRLDGARPQVKLLWIFGTDSFIIGLRNVSLLRLRNMGEFLVKAISIALVAGAALLSGCTTNTSLRGPVDVTRFHLGSALDSRSSLVVEAANGASANSPEFMLYADGVRAELNQLGFVPARGDLDSAYIATVSFQNIARGAYRQRSPISIGVGGGSHGSGVGVGGGLSFGLGGKSRQLYTTELAVQLRRRSDGITIWEGRATSESAGVQPDVTARRLAAALFKDFPGESGVTMTVK